MPDNKSYNYDNAFKNHIDQIKLEGRYRNFQNISRIYGKFPYAYHAASNKEIILWCINDYLGMGQNQFVKDAAIKAVSEMGTGAGGTRNIGGNNSAIVELEEELADLHSKESSLVFTSGYVANETTIITLGKIMPGLKIFSDAGNHASIIAGIKHSGCEKTVFRHNDADHLRSLISKCDVNDPKIIIFESVYSMDGITAPIAEICKVAKEYNALTYIDEVHTVGLYGKGGAGVANMLGLGGEIDIIQGTLGKAYGVIGGYIAGAHILIDAIRSTGPGFIFTTSLPPMIAAAARASIKYLRDSDLERAEHQSKVKYLKQKLTEAKIKFIENDSHIVPIIIGNPDTTRMISEKLLNDYDIFIQYINYPTVERGTERLRLTPTPHHTYEMIDALVSALAEVLEEIKEAQSAA